MSKTEGRKPKSLAVIVNPRNREDAARIEAMYDALQLAAHWSGYLNYQDMTRHFWERMAKSVADVVIQDGYTEVNAEIEDLVSRIRASSKRRFGSKA